MVKNMLRRAHKAKTTESQQRRHDLYQRTDEYKQVAMCAPSSSCCSAWPKPQQCTMSLSGAQNWHEGPGLLLDLSCLLFLVLSGVFFTLWTSLVWPLSAKDTDDMTWRLFRMMNTPRRITVHLSLNIILARKVTSAIYFQ